MDAPYDSAWDAIKARSEYINKKIGLIYNYHKSQDKPESKSKSGSASKYSKYNSTPNTEVTMIPSCISFIDEICLSITETFPDLWKIGQAYFSGELQVKVETGRQVEYKYIVMNVIETFCKHVRANLIPNSLEKDDKAQFGSLTLPRREEFAIYLPELLHSVRSAYSTFIKLDLPGEALDIVSMLLLDLRVHCISIIFQQTAEQVKLLKENWKINYSGKYTGVTEMPIKFLNLIENMIQTVKESVLSIEHREITLLDNQAAQKEMEKQMTVILNAFHRLIVYYSSDEYEGFQSGVPLVSELVLYMLPQNGDNQMNTPTWDHGLLITLSNCIFTKTTILDTISSKFKESGLPPLEASLAAAKVKYEQRETIILYNYLEQKCDPLVGTIEPSMYLGRFDWHLPVQPTDLRPYVKECLNNLIGVHFEIVHISPTLLDAVLPQIVETVAEELYRLMSCVQKFSREGALQARVDIMALHEFLSDFLTDKATRYFKSALDDVPPIDRTDDILVEDILRQCRTKMKTQIACLKRN